MVFNIALRSASMVVGAEMFLIAVSGSDYQLKVPFKKKIDSHHKELTLELTPTKKMISGFKKINPNLFLVGFKLEPDMTEASAYQESKLLLDPQGAACDVVIANTVKNQGYHGYIVSRTGEILGQATTREGMSAELVHFLDLGTY